MDREELIAERFLAETNTEFSTKYVGRRLWQATNTYKNTFDVTLRRRKTGEQITFQFYQTGRRNPNPADVLPCLSTRRIGNIYDFANEFGYTKWWSIETTHAYTAYQAEHRLLRSVYTQKELNILTEGAVQK